MAKTLVGTPDPEHDPPHQYVQLDSATFTLTYLGPAFLTVLPPRTATTAPAVAYTVRYPTVTAFDVTP